MELHHIPMYKTYDVVGYTYDTDTYCVGDCITQALDGSDPQSGLLAHVEQRLDEIAAESGIDRDDESSYDTAVFPKVIFAGMEFDRAPRCHGCGAVLDGFHDDTED